MKLDQLPPYLQYRLWQDASPQRHALRRQGTLPAARGAPFAGLLVAGGLLAFGIVCTVLPPAKSSALAHVQQTQERPLITLSSPSAEYWKQHPLPTTQSLPRSQKSSRQFKGQTVHLDEDFLWAEYDH